MPIDHGLEGKVAAITGGGGVLCGVIGQALAAAGVKVALLDLRPEAAAERAMAIADAGGQALAVEANVLDAASLRAAGERIASEFGHLPANRPSTPSRSSRARSARENDPPDGGRKRRVAPASYGGSAKSGANER